MIFIEDQTIKDIGKTDKQSHRSGEELVSLETVHSSHGPSLEAQCDVPVDAHFENMDFSWDKSMHIFFLSVTHAYFNY